MIEITATGDTTLHTAGKYCAEDILVKVPSGGGSSGGASPAGFCNIVVASDYSGYASIFYQGESGWNCTEPNDTLSTSIVRSIKVACGTEMIIQQAGYYMATISDGEIVYAGSGVGCVYQVPTTPDISITVDIITE